MKLDKCLVVDSVLLGDLKKSYSTCSKSFPQYALTMQFPCEFMETVDIIKPLGFRDAEEFKLQKADCGFLFELKNCLHQNFNVKLVHFNGKIYIYRGVYQYANYIADQIVNFLNGLPHDKPFESEPYKSWCDKEFKKESLVLHNYKIDKEDLFKTGLSV
jgi:hypothetical protein